jgi:endoglucanase
MKSKNGVAAGALPALAMPLAIAARHQRRFLPTLVFVAAIAGAATPTHAGSTLSFVGVNLSGGESGNPVTGVYGYNYIYPTVAEIDYFRALGVNFFRVPVVWQRMQPTQMGALSTTQLSYLDTVVAEAAKDHASVIIDDHDYGIAFGNDIGTAGTPTAAFVNYWTQLAEHFKGDTNIVFGIENEPHDQSATAWAAIDQAVITAIRSTGAPEEILASGSDWDGGAQWVSSGDAAALAGITDPLNQTVFEVHEYLDNDSTGTDCSIVSSTIGVQDLEDVTAWAQQNHKRVWLGEIGVCSDSTSLAALTATLDYLNENRNVWQGVTYWAGGPWMGSYMYTADPSPTTGAESPQTAALMSAY